MGVGVRVDGDGVQSRRRGEESREQDIHADIHTYGRTDIQRDRAVQDRTAQHSTGEDTVVSSRHNCACTAELYANLF